MLLARHPVATKKWQEASRAATVSPDRAFVPGYLQSTFKNYLLPFIRRDNDDD